MNELAHKMAKSAGRALLWFFGTLVALSAACGLWHAWTWAAPHMFASWPASITSPGFLPFAAAFVVLSLGGYGWRR